jgi:hypothetical protein
MSTIRRLAVTAVAVTALTGGLVAPASAAPVALAPLPDTSWWGANGRVNDIVVAGDRAYIAGGFDYVGPTTGYGVSVTAGDGSGAAGQAVVNGIVRGAVADGAGGWYVVGDFNRAGGKPRQGAAHITASGAVDGWAPKVKGGSVNAVALTTAGVLLGGGFTTVNDTAASRLAMVDAASGVRVPGWNGSANSTVRALAVAGDRVYLGGDFSSVSGATRTRLARVLTSTGAVDPAWAASASASVNALAVDGAVLYAGGAFTTVSGVARQRVAALATTGGAVQPFAPALDGTVQALAVDGTGAVHAGGLFGTAAGQPRLRLASFSATGTLLPLDAQLNGCHVRHGTKDANTNPVCTPEVSSLAVAGDTLFVGGRFSRSGGTVRHDAAAFSLTDGSLTGWDPVPGDRPLTLAAAAGRVFLGGDFTSVGGQVRKGVAAIDVRTGAIDPTFRADTDNFVGALELSTDGSRLYLAGAFGSVSGLPRSYLAAVDTATSAVVPTFKPNINNNVLEMAYAQGKLYIGGQFKRIDGQTRLRAAKLDGLTGAVDPAWRADTFGPSGNLRGDGMVMGVEAAPDGSKVYLGGPFTSVNGQSVAGGIIVVDGGTGALDPRRLGGVRGCGSIGPWVNRLYLSPDGKRLYGGDVCPDDVYQWDAVNLSSASNPTGLIWRTSCNGGMQGRLEVNGHFYYGTHGGNKGSGGACLNRPGGTWVDQQRFYAFDATNGYLDPYAPKFDTPMGVWSYGAVPGGLLVGGDFAAAGDLQTVQQGLAFFPGTP